MRHAPAGASPYSRRYHALVREGLRTMLSGEDGLRVVAEANDGQQALSLCRLSRVPPL